MPHERWGGVDRAEETWYNHGTTTIPTSSLGGLGCLQHLRGTGASFSRSLPITGRRFSTPIRGIRPPITMLLVASFADRPNLLKYEGKMHVCAARPSRVGMSKTCSDQAHAILHIASA